MSGLEWIVVTVIGVLLIVCFVVLELLFPPSSPSEHSDMVGRSMPRHLGSR